MQYDECRIELNIDLIARLKWHVDVLWKHIDQNLEVMRRVSLKRSVVIIQRSP